MSGLQGLEPKRARDLVLSVGTHRSNRPLSPIEVAQAMEVSVTAGSTLPQLAEALQLEDVTWVTRFRRLLQLPSDVQHLVNWGSGPSTVSLTASSEIARLASNEDKRCIMNAAIEHSLTSSEVRQVVQILCRSEQSADAAISSVVGQRPQVTRRHLLIGAVLSKEIQAVLQGMTQRERDDFLDVALRNNIPHLPPWSGRLGVDQFTLSGGEDFAAAIQGRPGGFEASVNAFLTTTVPGI